MRRWQRNISPGAGTRFWRKISGAGAVRSIWWPGRGICLVFVEVKYRRDGGCGEASQAVDRRKQQRLSRTAMCYCLERGIPEDIPCRFDVISVTGRELRHYENAFDFIR